jgi:hypothetical protein
MDSEFVAQSRRPLAVRSAAPAAMLAARVVISALVCGTLRTFLGDVFSVPSGTNRTFLP